MKPGVVPLKLSIVIAMAVLLSGCGLGKSDDTAIEWGVFKQLGPRGIKLVGQVDFCVGAPEPKIGRTKTTYSGQQVLIGLYLAAPRKTYQTEKCLGVIRAVYKTVTLKRNLASVELFDSNGDPSEPLWPD